MSTDAPASVKRIPYGAWYTTPGGLQYHPPETLVPAQQAAAERLRALDVDSSEPLLRPWTFARMYFLLAAIQLVAAGLCSVPLILFSKPSGSLWIQPIFIGACFVYFIALGVRAMFTSTSTSPEVMFERYLKASIGSRNGGTHAWLLESDKKRVGKRVAVSMLDGRSDPVPVTSFALRAGFAQYWKTLFEMNWLKFFITKLRDVKSVEPHPGVAVVEAEVRLSQHRLTPMFLSTGLMIVISGGAFLSGMLVLRFVDRDAKWVVIAIMVGFAALGFLASMVGTLMVLIPRARRAFRVRKILVRANDQWRIFNGELQGPEEGDVLWLLDEAPKSKE